MYWLRETAGWFLVLLGLFMFLAVYAFLQQHDPNTQEGAAIFEAFILAIVGVFVFRGGIHLLKVAVAARICQKADERLYPAAPTPARPLQPQTASAGKRTRS